MQNSQKNHEFAQKVAKPPVMEQRPYLDSLCLNTSKTTIFLNILIDLIFPRYFGLNSDLASPS